VNQARAAASRPPGQDSSLIERFLQRFEPGPECAAPELRLRLQVAIALIVASFGSAVVAVLWLLAEGLYERAAVSSVLAVAFGVEPLLLRRTGSMRLVAHLHSGLLSAGLGILIYPSGAQTTPPLLLTCLIPVSAALIAGARPALVWLAITVSGLVVMYGLVARGLTPMPTMEEAFLVRGKFLGSALVTVIMAMVTILYENVRLRRLRDLEAAHESLERVRREQLEMRDRFVSHVAHELRTPLSSLHMAVAGLLDADPGTFDEEQSDYLEIAQRNAAQLGKMIADLTEMMRAETGKLLIEREPVSSVEIVRRAVREQEGAARRREVRIRADADEGLAQVWADPTRVRQVLGNLIENAVKFSSREGEIVVRVRDEPGDEAFLRFSVCDRGAGIAAGELERIFDRLHQADPGIGGPGGLGLGLAICQELVTRHGGRIWAESQLGSGSTFHFTLPCASDARGPRHGEATAADDSSAVVAVLGAERFRAR